MIFQPGDELIFDYLNEVVRVRYEGLGQSDGSWFFAAWDLNKSVRGIFFLDHVVAIIRLKGPK